MMKVTSGQAMDDATRAALASGRAEPALGLFIDSLMEMRGLSEIAAEAISGAMLETEPPADMSPEALAMAFAAIEKGGAPGQEPFAYPELIKLPAVLVDAIRAAETGAGWRQQGPGIRGLRLNIGGEARAEILRIEAGAATPRHTHKGQELTLCLIGGYSDGRGSYGPGDVSIADPTVTHQPKADDDGACFVLAVTDAGLKFEGVLGAIQKLMGG
jgi:putative transcriptional regulator